MPLKLEVGAGDGKGRLSSRHPSEALGLLNEAFLAPGLCLGIESFEEFLAVELIELGFIVEEVLLRGRPVHEEEDDSLGLGCEVEPAFGDVRSEGFRREQGVQCERANADRSGTEQVSSRDDMFEQVGGGVHSRDLTPMSSVCPVSAVDSRGRFSWRVVAVQASIPSCGS